jgi:hypothetical protein
MIKFMSRWWRLVLVLDLILIPLVIWWACNLDRVAAWLSPYWRWL